MDADSIRSFMPKMPYLLTAISFYRRSRRLPTIVVPAQFTHIASGRVRLPFFCIDFLHDFDFKIALSQKLLEASIFPFEFLQPHGVRRSHAAVLATPTVPR